MKKEARKLSFLPVFLPEKMIGKKIKIKVRFRKDFIKNDGTCAIFIQLYQDKKIKRLPLAIDVKPENFSEKDGRVKSKASKAPRENGFPDAFS